MASFNPLVFEMSEQYESLVKNGKLSDVVLVAGGKELNVHKAVLSAQSPVFAAMFAHNSTKEAQESRVEIIDVDVEVLEMMVRYIYTGKVDNLDDIAAELLIAADKYQVDCLKSICEQQFMSMITDDSVSDLFIFADTYQVTELNSKCLEYITHICAGTRVKRSAGWNKLLLRADLLAKLLKHLNLKFTKLINDYEKLLKKKVESKKEDQNATELSIAADKYQIDSLKSICEQQLLSQITIESVSNLYIIADKHGATELYRKCLDYITDHGPWHSSDRLRGMEEVGGQSGFVG